MHFQPINDIRTGETTHHEVLIRLPAEDGTLISPDAFLTSAMRFGLMSEIDFWMIEHAARAYAQYSEPGRQLRLSVNLSANAFENDDLVEHVQTSLDKYGVRPTDIILEITESLAVRRPVHVDRQIRRLRDMGCQFALDDFGTGYSSFGYLQKLQFDFIKIDGTFVEDLVNNPVDQKMVRLIGEIGQEAGMKTIAEYVQGGPTLALLAELGIDLAQGYFIGRPTSVPTTKSMPIPITQGQRKPSVSTGENAS
jgi:EAL domain-containing protein (putative c-di-GMP-specific phosphodiesterase class I)